MRYFVYVDVDYYPYGECVDAESPLEAAHKVVGTAGSYGGWAAFVAPADQVLTFGDAYRVDHVEHPSG